MRLIISSGWNGNGRWSACGLLCISLVHKVQGEIHNEEFSTLSSEAQRERFLGFLGKTNSMLCNHIKIIKLFFIAIISDKESFANANCGESMKMPCIWIELTFR